MKHKLSIALLVSLMALAVRAQEQLPEYGNISDLRGLTKVYVGSDSTQSRKFILDELKKYKSLEVVFSPDEAQFIVECKSTGHVSTGSSLIRELETFEMTAYTLKGARRKIAWAATKTSVRYPPMLLTRDFLKALKKSR